MDRNTVIGIVLIVAILFGYTMYTMPSKVERARAQHTADSLATVELDQRAAKAAEEAAVAASAGEPPVPLPVTDSLISAADSALLDSLRSTALEQKFGVFQTSAEGTAEEVILGNKRMEIRFSTLGARPVVMRLKEYQTYRKTPLLLADPDSGTYELKFIAGTVDMSTEHLYFSVASKDSDEVVFQAATADPGKFLRITYTLDSLSYFMHMNAEFVGLKGVVDPRNVLFRWELAGLNHEKHLPTERQKCGVYYKYQGKDRNYLSETKAEDLKLEGRTNWVAFKQDFFTVAMVNDSGFSSNGSEIAIRPETDSTHTKHYSAKLFFDKGRDDEPAVAMRFYLGPNHFGTLRRTEIPQFQRIIDLGWGIFGFMNQWLVIPIFNWLDGWGWNYGIIILVLTIVIKLLLMPLTYKNLVASTKMRVLKPEMDVITEKHKDGDALKKQQATMDLYRKAGVNPASGCLPMLVQMPILYAMFRFFPASIELRQKSFLWADDLSSYDSIFSWTQQIPFISSTYGNHISLFTLLMAASTIVYSVINQKQMPTQQGMPSMKLMIYLFPIMMLFFLNNFSAGLSYYYLLANVISILQMTVLKSWFVDEEKIRNKLLMNMKTPKKKSKWQQRLEDMQKQQQAAKRRK
ncbi:MAG: membrane protein insertase YidC [Flavobacteriales bacterium]|nr:membrane protein insertase YidC [Flavobacteriales bacterium]MCC6936760.1 membrane protein insertase YidC [Flavobacteriales bacterium]